MRIIAGTFRSRQLKSLKGLALRPTSDRLRESLFNVLAERIPGCRFLDVFAGTGAIGIEALSRGAVEAVFIENHPPAATLIQKNLDSLGIRGSTRILKLDALRGLQRLAAEHSAASPSFDIVFLDPPYAAADEYRRVLTFLGAAPFLAPGALVIASTAAPLSFRRRSVISNVSGCCVKAMPAFRFSAFALKSTQTRPGLIYNLDSLNERFPRSRPQALRDIIRVYVQTFFPR
jgi:16S rRNA (guanine966-N2)-methyltransferase